MSDVHAEVDHLKEQIDLSAKETRDYICQLEKKVSEYDVANKPAERAAKFIEDQLDSSKASVNTLADKGKQLAEQAKTDVSPEAMQSILDSLHNVQDSLKALQATANEYDQKLGSGVAGSKATTKVEELVNAAKQRVTEALNMTSEKASNVKDMMQNLANKAQHGAEVGLGEAVKAVEAVDDKFEVTPTVSSYVTDAVEKVKRVDERYHLTQKATDVDKQVARGLGQKAWDSGIGVVQETIRYLSDTMQYAKAKANESTTAQEGEEKAHAAAEEAKTKATETKQELSDMMSDAEKKAQAMAQGAIDKANQAVGSAQEAVTGEKPEPPMSEQVAQKATEAKDVVMDKATEAKEEGKEVCEQGQSKLAEKKKDVADTAKQEKKNVEGEQSVGSAVKDTANEGAGAVKDTANEGAEAVAQGKETAKSKMSETAKEGDAKAKEMAENTKSGATSGSESRAGSGKQPTATGSTG